jgi:hypothetical protein
MPCIGRQRNYYLRRAIFSSSIESADNRLRPHRRIVVRVSDRGNQRNNYIAGRSQYLAERGGNRYRVGDERRKTKG